MEIQTVRCDLWFFVVASVLCVWFCAQSSAQCPSPFLPSDVLPTLSYNYTHGPLAERITQLQADTAAMIQTNKVDGYSVAVIHRNTTIFTAGAVDTPFRIGSVTKVFVAMGALLLRQQERLSLDDPVTRFLPNFSIINKFDTHIPTLRELMGHVSGIPRDLCAKVYDCGDVSEDDALKSIAKMELARPPWNFLPIYSDLGISLLGHAWEKATSPRMSWSDYIKSNILNPLSMNNTGVDFATVQLAPGNIFEYPSNHSMGWSGPAGDMYSTASDLAKLLKFLVNPKPALLSPSVIREWTRPATVFPGSTSAQGFALPWETLSVSTSTNVSVPIITKSGGIGSYSALIAFDPATELGVAVTVSDTTPNDTVGADAVVFKILGDLIPAVSSVNSQLIVSLYTGVYACNKSQPVLSKYRHVGYPVYVGNNDVNKTLQVNEGSSVTITAMAPEGTGLSAALNESLMVDGAARPQVFSASLVLKSGPENRFWAYPGSCSNMLATLTFLAEEHRPNYPDSYDLLEFQFDPAAGLLRWPSYGAVCHKSG